MHQSISGDYLLPNLQALRWSDYSRRNNFTHIHLFLGPRITSIQIEECLTNAELALLPVLTRLFPSLTGATITANFPSDVEAQNMLSAFVRGLQKVEFLHTAHLDLPALEHLGRLETLETLKLSHPAATSCSGLSNRGLFSNLRWVDLYPGTGNIE